MTAPLTSDGRLFNSPLLNHADTSPAREPLLVAPPTTHFPATRELASTRGRALGATSPQNASPRNITPASQARAKQSIDLERRPSASYRHHRDTSIVHGAVQHSRNPSLLSTSTVSPLSPQKGIVHSAGHEGPVHVQPPGLKKSPSASALSGATQNGSAASLNRSFGSNGSQRRPDPAQSSRPRRHHDHQRTMSRAIPADPEIRNVGEFALHHLLTVFIAEADLRIERCLPVPGRPEVRTEDVCGPGADPAFDQLLSSLGHINKHDPSNLITAIVNWRREKADLAHEKSMEVKQMNETIILTQRTVANGTASQPASPPASENVAIMQHDLLVSERRSGVSIYILCRVLIEVLSQTTLPELNRTTNTAARLEEVIYGQLQSAEPESLAHSPFRRTNWAIRGQLVGVMSGLRFKEVAGRFILDLEKAHKKLSIKGVNEPRLASKTALLVQSMRWLKVLAAPDAAWQDSCDVLQVLARYFSEVHGRIMKHAYAELFEHLLLPIAATAETQLGVPKWKSVLNTIQPRVSQMLPKADHWPYVFPLQAVLLCVSPTDHFATHWLPLVASFQPKARDRAARSHALKAICRLVWRFLFRMTMDTELISVIKKLDEIVKLVFQGGKRYLISTDAIIADPLIQLIRFIGYRYPEYCFRTIVFPLMNSDQLMDSQLKIENLDPEKTVIAIRAFLAIMADKEAKQPPIFPTSFECDSLLDPSSRSPITHRRTRSQGVATPAARADRLSRPVVVELLDDSLKPYYERFCKILGNLTIICDNTFGGQAVLDEKLATHTPKTPMAEAFTFNKRDDITNPTDLRQNHYDLLHVAVEALPRCLSPQIQINPLVNLLCTGTAHVESHIATSSAQSLKAIARQSYAQPVTIGFARFIFSFDDRYQTVSDGSLLGPGHIQNTLQLYVELLQIWIEEIDRKTRKAVTNLQAEDASSKQLPLDLSGILAHVDEIEAHGLFFLCSPSPYVRTVAISVLRLVTKFDQALGKPLPRIIDILEGSTDRVISITDERLTVAERSRLQNGLRKHAAGGTLVELCSSDIEHDANLWMKIFPNLVKLSSQECLHAVALTRELVCLRLSHSYKPLYAILDLNRQPAMPPFDQVFQPMRSIGRLNTSSPDIIIEQWKIHLLFACTTLTNIGSNNLQASKSSQSSQHTRKSSKSSGSSANLDKIASATELFTRVAKFLSVPNAHIRHAAVDGLGATNVTLFHTLLECLQPYVAECNGEVKARIAAQQRQMSAPARTRKTDCLRTEITRLLSLVCHHLHAQPPDDDYALTYLADYSKNTRLFLSDAEIQSDLSFQKLRTYFCSLTEGIFEYTRKLKEPTRYISFQSRQATFSLMENWCGFSPNETELRKHEEYIRRSMLERELDIKNRGIMTSTFQKEKSELQTAALGGMATLCSGPLTFTADNRTLMHFNVQRMLAWVQMIFATPSDRNHAIGRKALRNLISHNLDEPSLIGQTVRMCYTSKDTKALASYFDVVAEVISGPGSATVPYWKVMCVALYTLGNEDAEIRMKSARLLRTFEDRSNTTTNLRDLDISVSDKTTAVYKLAQFEVSRRLAAQYPELAFYVFSEFSAYFKELEPDHQRNMVTAMLPWIQKIQLQREETGVLPPSTYMLLVNLYEITAKSSIGLHNEIQALWQALATGRHCSNVPIAMEFIFRVCMDKKEQGFIHYSKQIVVFLSSTPAGKGVVDNLLAQIEPKNMTNDGHLRMQPPPEQSGLPYIADMTSVVPGGGKISGLSKGQLSMLLLVDLVVSPFTLPLESVVPLLHIALVKWDNPTDIVQDQARELLVHLIHELVITKIDPQHSLVEPKAIEAFVEAVRRKDQSISWTKLDEGAAPEAMAYVLGELLTIFSTIYPDVKDAWSKLSLHWANCANLHVASRSLQLFRCLNANVDRSMLAEMVSRLSTAVADLDNRHVQAYALETLKALRTSVASLSTQELIQCPEIFWVTCAILDTNIEAEFQEALRLLDAVLDKLDLTDEDILHVLSRARPTAQGFRSLPSLTELLHKGTRSSHAMDRTIKMMQRLVVLPASDIIGQEDRVTYAFLANMPSLMKCFNDYGDPSTRQSAAVLATAARANHQGILGGHLQAYADSQLRNLEWFVSQTMMAVRETLLLENEFAVLVFMLGMVNNDCDWFKINVMEMLQSFIPRLDMRNPQLASQGADLISPLLRLLQTEHYPKALAVLDNIIQVTETPNDSKHLRMSMAGSYSSRATRKEYENTRSLYGIPEESGWSVPMPAMHTTRVRAYLTALTHTMTEVGGVSFPASTPELGFAHENDDATYATDRMMTMTSDDTQVDGNMGELAMQLDDLDDFFDDYVDGPASPESPPSPMRARYPSGLIEQREALYDQQALPLLHKSLKRNTSVNSLQRGLADFRYPPSREPPIMTPGAFAHDEQHARPGLHNRSVTSPVTTLNHVPQPHGYRLANGTHERQELSFSDDEAAFGRVHTADEAQPSELKKGSMRQGFLRRLTSSSGSRLPHKDGAKSFGPLRSPKMVPKVPALPPNNPSSSEL